MENTAKKKILTRKTKQAIFCFCLVIIPVIQFILLYLLVNVNSVFLAFQDTRFDTMTRETIVKWVGFSNLKNAIHRIFTLKEWSIAIKNSLAIYVINFILRVPLNQVVSFFIYKRAKIGGWLKVLFYTPTIMSTMVCITVYDGFFNQCFPELLNNWFGGHRTSYLSASASVRTRQIFIFLFGYWNGFGSSMILYTNAMEGISDSIVEAAQLDGITFFGELLHITFPMIFPTFKMLVMTGFCAIFGNAFHLFELFGLSADPQLSTVGYIIYRDTNLSPDNYSTVAATGLFITIIMVPATLLLRKFLNKIDPMGD